MTTNVGTDMEITTVTFRLGIPDSTLDRILSSANDTLAGFSRQFANLNSLVQVATWSSRVNNEIGFFTPQEQMGRAETAQATMFRVLHISYNSPAVIAIGSVLPAALLVASTMLGIYERFQGVRDKELDLKSKRYDVKSKGKRNAAEAIALESLMDELKFEYELKEQIRNDLRDWQSSFREDAIRHSKSAGIAKRIADAARALSFVESLRVNDLKEKE
ncbi:hypothetical protein [Mycolicibacter heraklionensis]|uniref:hypothetical protein n=1 Tax=Mycolicibacter heraklionensis TaxID=512402 RepID=UPI00103D12A5|nr:hypothetical protein [Mycolicibacter heraklionensis]